MNALFVNYPEPQCGVSQFGRNLWVILKDSNNVRWSYAEPTTLGEFRTFTSMPEPDAVLYNWQGGQGGFLSDAPFQWLSAKQYLCYHDLNIDESRWSGIFFSDPTMIANGKWHVMGRPLPVPTPYSKVIPILKNMQRPIIGVHGFIGAWADQVVHRVMNEFESATIRMSLPFATYGDKDGAAARTMAERCRNMVGRSPYIKLMISHDFLKPDELITWLAQNDLNCYIRPADMNWRGVSSAPDFALAVRKPIAINRCNAFRHLHNLSQSICVEDNSLMDIIGNGLAPLVKLYSDWSPENVRKDIETVLLQP